MQTASFYGFRPKTVRSPSQNRMFLVRKPYGFGTENVKGRQLEVRKPYGFGTENVKGRQLETDSIPFNNTLSHSLLNKLSN